jgi:hypothetical protein
MGTSCCRKTDDALFGHDAMERVGAMQLMDILVATESGLYLVVPGKDPRLLGEGPMLHVVAADEGSVALDADGTLWNVDDEGVATEFDQLSIDSPTCLLLDGDDIWVGSESARLAVVRGPEVTRNAAFDQVAGRDAWYTPWGGPPVVRSMDIDDEGVLYVAVHVGGVLVSRDHGETWDQTPFDIDLDVHQVATVPEYAKTVVAACGSGVAISTDEGETWDVVTAGLHSPYSRAVAVTGDSLVCSVSDGPDGEQSALYRMPLDGDRFTPCEAGLPTWFSGNVDTHCLAAWDEIVVAGTPDGAVYLSSDHGVKWEQVARELPAIRAVALP